LVGQLPTHKELLSIELRQQKLKIDICNTTILPVAHGLGAEAKKEVPVLVGYRILLVDSHIHISGLVITDIGCFKHLFLFELFENIDVFNSFFGSKRKRIVNEGNLFIFGDKRAENPDIWCPKTIQNVEPKYAVFQTCRNA
jgi:hypothetical protein